MNHQHTVLRTAQILTRDETAKKCRRGNIVVYWPTLYFFQYLFWLNFPVFLKFSSLVFWQSSKKKSTIGKLPQYLGWRKSLAFFQRCTITLTSMHNNQDSNCVAYPPILILIICMMLANPKNTTVFVEQLYLTNTWKN